MSSILQRGGPMLHMVEVYEEQPRHRPLAQTYAALEWLAAQKNIKHFDIDMHGGVRSYTSFYFRHAKDAVSFKLHCC